MNLHTNFIDEIRLKKFSKVTISGYHLVYDFD